MHQHPLSWGLGLLGRSSLPTKLAEGMDNTLINQQIRSRRPLVAPGGSSKAAWSLTFWALEQCVWTSLLVLF